MATGEFSENSIEEARNVVEEVEQQLEKSLGLLKFVCSHLTFLSTSVLSLSLPHFSHVWRRRERISLMLRMRRLCRSQVIVAKE